MSQTTHASPWLTMWTQPRETIRSIIQTNPRYGVFWLSTLYVLQNLFFFLNFHSWGLLYPLYSLLIPVLTLSPILGYIWVFFYGWLLRFIGRWLGGTAPGSHLRAALAWSRIPLVIGLAMWLALLIANPDYVFIQYVVGPSALFLTLILSILEIWTFVLFVQAIREVQHFTLLRALSNILIAAIIYSIVSFAAYLVVRALYLHIG